MIAAFICLESCNAPHNNPLDPVNPGYPYVILEGSVQTYSLPYAGIPGASVYWLPSNTLVNTDNNGNFKITNIQPVNGKLIFTKNGYRPDTLDVIWGSSKLLNFQVNLNVIPSLDSILIYTVVINQYSAPGQTYQLAINAKVSDKDNDIDTVFVENSQLNLRSPLNFDAVNKIYETTLTTQNLNISDIEQTIGLDFDIVAKDVFNREYIVGSSKVTRVIKNAVQILYPTNDTTIAANPVLSWQRFKAGFLFHYKIEIYTNDFANSQLVFTGNNISSDSVSYYLTAPLTSGNYYWVIWLIDQFQNRSRSLPATFTIK